MVDKENRYLKVGVVGAFIVIFMYLIVNLNIFDKESIMELILNGSSSISLEIFFIAIVSVLLIFFVPLSWLTLGATILFGLKGAILITAAGLISATISFSLARLFKNDISKIIEKIYYKKEKRISLDEIYTKIKEYGFGYVVFLRSVPFIPFSIGNYIFGVSFVSFKEFIFATLLSVSIGQSINVYFFQKAMEIGESPVDTLIAAAIKGVYFLLLILWQKKSKYSTKE